LGLSVAAFAEDCFLIMLGKKHKKSPQFWRWHFAVVEHFFNCDGQRAQKSPQCWQWQFALVLARNSTDGGVGTPDRV